MAETFSQLKFVPTAAELIHRPGGNRLTVITGQNNSGKSAYLKQLASDRKKLYIGANRFYSFHHLALYNDNENELDDFFNSLSRKKKEKFQNFEQSFFNMNNALTRLSDGRRKVLFDAFEDLFGQKVEVKFEIPDNVFSKRFLAIDDESLSVTSSGTRLFLGILAALMDERFNVVAIDEPELGLAPALQSKLAQIVVGERYNDKLLPHKPHIVLSTHSHIFLDKRDFGNNFIVSKNGDTISAAQCSSMSQLQEIQFSMLGNELRDIFLPDLIVFVEGGTDKLFLETIIKAHVSDATVVIEACGGDIAARLSYWSSTLGDFQISPYRSRTFVVYDSVKQAGLDRITARLGIARGQLTEWSQNGIEYLYPLQLLREVFRSSELAIEDLEIVGDRVKFGEIVYTKMDLCRLVCEKLTSGTELSVELREKFINPIVTILNG
ncbi:MAG: AAA family ATPase [Pseudomonadota bacterium]